MNELISNLIAPDIALALQPVKGLLTTTAAVAGINPLDSTVSPDTPSLPIQIEAVRQLLVFLSGVPNYDSPDVYEMRTNMRNDVLRVRANVTDLRLAVVEQRADAQALVIAAQGALQDEIIATQGAQSARLDELSARLELVKAIGQNLALDLAANQAHDMEQDARITAEESVNAQQFLAQLALQKQQDSTAAALAANSAADALNAAQDAVTQATAAQALVLGQVEHATNVAQQSQIEANAAQDALDRARQTAGEAAIAQAQATATAALQKATDDATAASQAQAAAQAAQASANTANAAAATAQAQANTATANAATAQATATSAQAAAATAQAKADADATAAANAQATATAAQQAAATNATALAALQATVAGKLDSSLVRRGSITTPAVTIAVATPATAPVMFATAFADTNYEVFLSKPAGGLLGIELGWQNKTTTGFTLTLRNTGVASLAVAASAADYFAIHN